MENWLGDFLPFPGLGKWQCNYYETKEVHLAAVQVRELGNVGIGVKL
jgi:hypothetical protein